MTFTTYLRVALTLLLSAFLLQANAQDAPRVIEEEGVIQELNFGENQMIVNGVAYVVPDYARVSIRGSHGAFTMLTVGMKVSFIFEDRGSSAVVKEIEQLPDNHQLLES